MLGEVVGRHESKDVCFEAFKVGIVERLDGGVLNGAVHPLGLAIGPNVSAARHFALAQEVCGFDTVGDKVQN